MLIRSRPGLAMLVLAGCSGSPDAAPAPAPAPTKQESAASPAPLTDLRESPAWQVGNWWLYQVEHTIGDDTEDEDLTPPHRLLREVIRVESHEDGTLLVTVRQQGGTYVKHEMVLAVSDTCVTVQSSGHKVYCTSPDAAPAETLPGPLKLRVDKYVSSPFVTAFDSRVGIVSTGSVARANRTSSTTLVGFRVGEREEGEPKELPVGCALNRTEDGTGSWTAPGGHSIEVRKAATPAGTTVTVMQQTGENRVERAYEIAGAPPTKVAMLMVPDGDRCVLRVRSNHAPSTKVLDLDVASPEMPRIRGSLAQ